MFTTNWNIGAILIAVITYSSKLEHLEDLIDVMRKELFYYYKLLQVSVANVENMDTTKHYA